MSKEAHFFQQPEWKEKKELPRDIDAIYVLASGEPTDEKLSMDAKIRSLAALELLKRNKGAKIYFVGGKTEQEKQKAVSERMADYFLKRAAEVGSLSDEGDGVQVEILNKSNNTAGNIEEIIDTLEPAKRSVVLSNEYHLNRINEIMKHYNLGSEVFSAEEALRKRSRHHNKFVERYEDSWEYLKKEATDKLMLLYVKLDPEQKIVKKWRTYSRQK